MEPRGVLLGNFPSFAEEALGGTKQKRRPKCAHCGHFATPDRIVVRVGECPICEVCVALAADSIRVSRAAHSPADSPPEFVPYA